MATDNSQYNDHSHISHMPTAIDGNNKRLLVANYSQNSQKYSTNHQVDQGFNLQSEPTTSHDDHDQLQHQSPAAAVRRRSSFRDYIAYAYRQTVRADHYYLISSLLCLNVFMSILNTILLSFVVKSLQLGDHKLLFGDGKLAWDTHLEGMILDVPASVVQGHTLSVTSIESHGLDEPLVIGGLNDEGDDTNESSIDQLSTSAPGDHWSQSQLLISTGSGEKAASYIGINGITRQRDPRVTIVTDSLLVNKLSKLSTFARSNELDSVQKPEAKHRDKSSKQRGKVIAERMLELDTRRQMAVLPLLERVELAPPPASVLHANNMLRCDSGISGTVSSNLDVQMRVGNLTCHSGRTLALVSRSGKLNLAPLDSLLLDAPTLQMSAPTTKRLTISGIEFVNMEQQRPTTTTMAPRSRLERGTASSQRPSRRDEQSGGDERQLRQLQKVSQRARGASVSLRAYNLVLANGVLMATSD